MKRRRMQLCANFEILGEAAHNVELHYSAFSAAHADVPWALMYTMRNRIAHGYFKVHKPQLAGAPFAEVL